MEHSLATLGLHNSGCTSGSSSSAESPTSTLTRSGQRILGKGTSQRLLAAGLLAADKTLDCDGDGTIDVLGRTVLRQPHAAEGLGNANDGLEVTNLSLLVY